MHVEVLHCDIPHEVVPAGKNNIPTLVTALETVYITWQRALPRSDGEIQQAPENFA